MTGKQVENMVIKKIHAGTAAITTDKVAVEEPLQIELLYSTATGLMQKNIAVTMRTPGHDDELAAGFLFTEGIIKNAGDIAHIKKAADNNRILVHLKENIIPVLANTSRNFYSTSSCGICGKASMDAIQTISQYGNENDSLTIHAAVLNTLPTVLKNHQKVFEDTGGIHASGLFTPTGDFIMLREDVGRHNALDKLIGTAILHDQLPLNDCILLLSGRISFELVQKATMAGIKIIAAVGAPSSLAVELAKESGITTIGFLRAGRFNIYAGEKRIVL